MKCLECSREIRSINYRHLKYCSGLTPAEYRTKYPGESLMDSDVKKSCGLPKERNPNWKGGINSPHCKQCGKPLSLHSYLTHCRRCSSTLKDNHFKGRKHTDSTREKMKASAKLRDPATYVFGIASPEVMSTSRKNYWKKIPHEDRSRLLASFIVAGQKSNKKNSKTRIENTVAEILTGLDVPHERNVQLGRYNVDFLVQETLIVECLGDYWHCNPALFKPTDYNKSLHMTAKEKWAKDEARRETLIGLGYRFVSIWESDLINDKSTVFTRIEMLLKGTNDYVT